MSLAPVLELQQQVSRLGTYASVPLALAGLVIHSAWDQRIPVQDLRSDCRRRELVDARSRIAIEARLLGYSLWQIGRALNRDHSTIMHALSKMVDTGELGRTAYANHGKNKTGTNRQKRPVK